MCYNQCNPPRNRWQGRRISPTEGVDRLALCLSRFFGRGDEGEPELSTRPSGSSLLSTAWVPVKTTAEGAAVSKGLQYRYLYP